MDHHGHAFRLFRPDPLGCHGLFSDVVCGVALGRSVGFGIGLVVTGGAGYMMGKNSNYGLAQVVRCMLWGLMGALVAYNYYALGLPGATWFEPLGNWGGLLITMFGGVIGLLLYRWLGQGRRA